MDVFFYNWCHKLHVEYTIITVQLWQFWSEFTSSLSTASGSSLVELEQVQLTLKALFCNCYQLQWRGSQSFVGGEFEDASELCCFSRTMLPELNQIESPLKHKSQTGLRWHSQPTPGQDWDVQSQEWNCVDYAWRGIWWLRQKNLRRIWQWSRTKPWRQQ